MISFDFIFNCNIHFQYSARNILKDILRRNNYHNIALVIDKNLLDVKIIKDLLHKVKDQIIKVVVCDKSDPTYDKLEEIRVSQKDYNIDAVSGIGGGSTLDMAKALSVLYANDGPALSYRGFNKFETPIPPIIAIPTTSGTGSEITPNASLTDTKENRKMGINGEAIRPKYAIMDPELTLSCPRGPTISAGVDSLVHATEAFVAKKTNPMARMFAKEGFKLVFENLPLLVDDLENIELREQVMYGAFLSAIALMNSGTGPAAAMSYPLSVHYGVPHGIGGGIFLPFVVKYNINQGFYDYADLSPYGKDSESKEKMAFLFIENMWNIWQKLSVPRELNSFGLTKGTTETFIRDTMDLKPALDQNPVLFSKKEISATLDKLLPE